MKKGILCILIVALVLACVFAPSVSMAQEETEKPAPQIETAETSSEGAETAQEAAETVPETAESLRDGAETSELPTVTAETPQETAEMSRDAAETARFAANAMGEKNGVQTVIDIFPDRALADVVADALGKSYDSPVTQGELNGITELYAFTAGVTDLTGIGTLQNLVSLNLMYNDVGTLPAEIGNLKKLEELKADSCGLSTLPVEIGELVSLKTLTLQSNGMTSVPDTLGNLPALETLDLSARNHFEKFPTAVFRIKSLTRLGLSNVGLGELPAEIGKLTNLRELILDSNQIKSIPKEIGQLKKLERLFMRDNALTSVPREYGDLVSLKGINLENNELTTVPDEITRPQNIEYINLNCNALTELPEGIGKLQKLNALFVSDNNLTFLPEEICGCPSLTRIHADNNEIEFLPEGIGWLDQMYEMFFAGNRLRYLPDEIGYFASMVALDVSGNKLSFLPDTFVNLERCYDLSLANNEFYELPDAVCEMPALATLDLSWNHLTDISMLPARIDYEAENQDVTIAGYRKGISYPYYYEPSPDTVILWDRGYEMNEVENNDFYNGRTFLMERTPAGGTIKGPSGKFSIRYTIDFRSGLIVDSMNIQIEVGEVYELAPTSNVMDGYSVSYSAQVESGDDVVWLDPATGQLVGLSPGMAFLKIRGEVDGAGIVGETTCAVTVTGSEIGETQYTVLDGGGQRMTDPSQGLRFRIDAPLDEFENVWVDDILLKRGTEYTLSEGSTIITLEPSFLRILENGTHTLTAKFTDGYAQIEFTVAVGKGAPKTDDGAAPFLLLLAATVAGATMGLGFKKLYAKR